MHHMLFYRCIVPRTMSASSVFEPFVNHTGEECYFPGEMEEGTLPTQYCTDMHYGFAIGGKTSFLPEHLGIPIGQDEEEYYLFQTHMDNPALQTGIMASIRMNIHYTPTLRQHDAGFLNIGYNIPGSPSFIIPPRSQDHRFSGHCSSQCTQKILPPEGIKVAAAILHSHNAGRRLKLQHFRNNRELPWILSDDNFIFRYQLLRFLRKEVVIQPGDHVTMRK